MENIPLIKSSCHAPTGEQKTFVVDWALLNPASSNPMRRCLSSPLCNCKLLPFTLGEMFKYMYNRSGRDTKNAIFLNSNFCSLV